MLAIWVLFVVMALGAREIGIRSGGYARSSGYSMRKTALLAGVTGVVIAASPWIVIFAVSILGALFGTSN